MTKIRSSINLVNSFFTLIREWKLLLTKKFLISFSGGQDSICLIILITQLVRQLNLCYAIIYCNHFWTSKNLYQLYHITKVSFSFDKVFFSLIPQKQFNEKDARLWRYSLIYRVSQFYNYKIIVTAHTQTDQIETFLLNLFRGSSTKGLSIFHRDQFLTSNSLKSIFLSERELNEY